MLEPAVLLALASAFGGLITAFAFWLRENASARSYSDKARADGYTLQEKSRADVVESLTKIVEQGNEFQRQGIVIQQNMLEAMRDNTRVNDKHAGEMRGMVIMMNGFGDVLKNAVVGVDDLQGQTKVIGANTQAIREVVDTLETNLGEGIADQLGPIVDVLTGIRAELKDLSHDISSIDDKFTKRVNELLERFERAEAWLMKELTPIAEEHIQELVAAASHPRPKESTQEIKPV
jgi:hypothetical protein